MVRTTFVLNLIISYNSIIAILNSDRDVIKDFNYSHDITTLSNSLLVNVKLRENNDIESQIKSDELTHQYNSTDKFLVESQTNTTNIKNKYVEIFDMVENQNYTSTEATQLSRILNKNTDLYPISSIRIEVQLGSDLIVTTPGTNAEIYFEVTNLANTEQSVRFTCSDQRYILRSLSSFSKQLAPQETTILILRLNTKVGIYQDEITLSAYVGTQIFQKKIIVDVGTQFWDQTPPELSYVYTSDCTGILQCAQGTWNLEVTAVDTDSGLLRLSTQPIDIYFASGYVSGSRNIVTGYVSDSCCNPDIEISAVDRLNNRKTISINAYKTTWRAGSIAALVLGILLLLFLIAAAIIYCVIKKRRQKESYTLPRYKGGKI